MHSTEPILHQSGGPILVRLPAVKSKTGLARTQIYAGMASGTFPKPVKLGKRAVGWLQAEIDVWIADRIAARDREGAA